MRINNVRIEQLHNFYDYDIDFNDDVTLLHGDNGCGKTTVLNLIDIILTARVFKLFEYDFKKISIKYTIKKKIYKIMVSLNKSEQQITLNFNNSISTISKLPFDHEERYMDSQEEVDFFRLSQYSKAYPVLVDVAEEFMYMYLAVNRNENIKKKRPLYNFRVQNSAKDIKQPLTRDDSLIIVENLIQSRWYEINNELKDANQNFRDTLIRRGAELEEISSIQNTIKYADRDDIRKKINEFKSLNKRLESKLNIDINTEEALTNFEKSYEEYSEKETKTILNLFLSRELNRLARYSSIVEEFSKQEEKIQKPITLFIDIVNEFFRRTNSKKEIGIINGDIYFSNDVNAKKYSVHFLSSGEKQLLMYFSNLIFAFPEGKEGIYIVDEPELSMHIDWQEILIDKSLEANPKLQYIYATHSPSIAQGRRDYFVWVERLTNDNHVMRSK